MLWHCLVGKQMRKRTAPRIIKNVFRGNMFVALISQQKLSFKSSSCQDFDSKFGSRNDLQTNPKQTMNFALWIQTNFESGVTKATHEPCVAQLVVTFRLVRDFLRHCFVCVALVSFALPHWFGALGKVKQQSNAKQCKAQRRQAKQTEQSNARQCKAMQNKAMPSMRSKTMQSKAKQSNAKQSRAK